MPITYEIDRGKQVIRILWTGEIRKDEVMAAWKALMLDPEALAIRRDIADLREAKLLFSGDELALMVQTILVPAFSEKGWKSAIVVVDELQFGVSRQYQVYRDSHAHDAIFKNYDEALAWLLQDE